MSFLNTTWGGIIIDGDIIDAEAVAMALKENKKKKQSPFCINPEFVEEAVEETDEPVVEELLAMALEEFKQEKTKVLRKFTNSLKLVSSMETILALIVELQQSFATMADNFKEASTFAEAKPVEPVASTSTWTVKKKVIKLKFKEGVTAAKIDEEFLAEFEGLEVEEPKKKKVVKKKYDEDNEKGSVEGGSDKEDDGFSLFDC
jgi:hypothetical protein